MQPNAVLPVEIFDTVIDQLAHERPGYDDTTRMTSLQNLALVCHYFARECRKHLFYSVVIDWPPSYKHVSFTSQFATKVADFPHLAPLVRELHFSISACGGKMAQSFRPVKRALKKLSQLQMLSISSRNAHVWERCNNYKPMFLHLFQNSTIATLQVINIRGFSLYDLVHCTGLKSLSLFRVTFSSVLPPNPPPFQTIRLDSFTAVYSCPGIHLPFATKASRNSPPLIDFTRLSYFCFTAKGDDDLDMALVTSNELYFRDSVFTRLVTVIIDVSWLEIDWITFGLAKLLNSSIKTLKHLTVSGPQFGTNNHPYPLFALISELGRIEGSNVLETLNIEHTWAPPSPLRLDGWEHITDSLLKKDSWKHLKHVSLKLRRRVFPEDEEDLDSDERSSANHVELFAKRIQQQLRRLQENNKFQFDFDISMLSY